MTTQPFDVQDLIDPTRHEERVQERLRRGASEQDARYPSTARARSRGADVAPNQSLYNPEVLTSIFDDPTASERSKQAALWTIAPATFSRIMTEQEEAVGEPVRSKSLLQRTFGLATDIVGKPLGKAMWALGRPAQWTEQAIGIALTIDQTDMSLATRWQLGKLTWEGGTWYDAKKGRSKLLKWQSEMDSGVSIDEIVDAHEGGWQDIVGQLVFDPLWLLGGLPGVPSKLYKTADVGADMYKAGKAARAFRFIAEGVRPADSARFGKQATALASRLPKPFRTAARLIGGDFVPTETRIWTKAVTDWSHELKRPLSEAWGDWMRTGPFRYTPQAKATKVYNLFNQIIIPSLREATPEDLRLLQDAIAAHDVTKVPAVFGSVFNTEQGQILMKALRDAGVDITKFPTLSKKIILKEGAKLEDLKALHALADGAEHLPEVGKARQQWKELTGRNWSETFPDADVFVIGTAALRSHLGRDIHNIVYPALQRVHGVPGEEITRVVDGVKRKQWEATGSSLDKFNSGMKFALGMAFLNTPRFVVLNYINNAVTVAADHGLWSGFKMLRHPLGGLSDETWRLLREDGFDEELLKMTVGDRNVARELLFQQETGSKLPTILSPMVSLASKIDMGARIHAFATQYSRMRQAMWQFEGAGYGVIPNLPENVLLALGEDGARKLRGEILAAGPNQEKLAAVVQRLKGSGLRPRMTVDYFIEKIADERNLTGDARQAFNARFPDTWREAINRRVFNEHLPQATHVDDIPGLVDNMLGELRAYEHEMRRLDNLYPKTRDYKFADVARADYDALMVERGQMRATQVFRTLAATGVDEKLIDEVVSALGVYDGQVRDFMVVGQRKGAKFARDPRPASWAEYYDQADEVLKQTRLALQGKLAGKPKVAAMLDRLLESERLFMQRSRAVVDVEDMTDLAYALRDVDNLANEALQREATLLGFQHKRPPYATQFDYPIHGERASVEVGEATKLLEDVKNRLPAERLSPAGDLVGDAADELVGYLDSAVRAAAGDVRPLAANFSRAMTDFTMLNYDEKLGLDRWLQIVYPFSFWPSRSMWHWAQRTAQRPGASVAPLILYDRMKEMNDDMPARFRGSVKIPIPFLDEALSSIPGVGPFIPGEFFFDPLKVMFPMANWSNDMDFADEDAPKNFWGVMHGAAKSYGMGLNPVADTALQRLSGDERAFYLKNRLAGLPVIPAGPRVLQSMWMFLRSGQEDPGTPLSEEDKEEISTALATGGAVEPSKIQQYLGLTDDDFDIYRKNRMLVDMTMAYSQEGHTWEERKAFSREVLDAMFTRKGRLWAKAGKLSATNDGLATLTGWAFGMPVRMYPEDEERSRTLNDVFREEEDRAREAGEGSRTADLYNYFPEASVREAAVAILDSPYDAPRELAQRLYAIDLEEVRNKYDPEIEKKTQAIDSLARSKRLETDDGQLHYDVLTEELSALQAAKSEAIDVLDYRYRDRTLSESLNRTPRTRALQTLERKYYEFELPDNPASADFTKREMLQKAFLETLPVEAQYSPVTTSVEHYVTQATYREKIDAAYADGDRRLAEELAKERDEKLRAQGEAVLPLVTRDEFERYLARNKRVPTPEENDFLHAKEQIHEYFGIKEAATSLGYTKRQVYEVGQSYWSTHPLLERFYGSPDIEVSTMRDLSNFDRMETIWEQFRSLEGGSQARIDYLAMTLDELNELRRSFNLPPIRITDPYWEIDPSPPRYDGSFPEGY